MSDTEAKDSTETKKRGRGRPAGSANKEKASPKKRPAEDAVEEHEESAGEDEKPKAKRGRGRPKGSGGGAKASKPKKPKVPGRGRGRPKKNAA